MTDEPDAAAAWERIDQLSEAANVQGLVALQNEMRKSFQVTTRLLLFVAIMIPSLIFQNAYLGLVGSVVLAGAGSGGRFRNVIGSAGFAGGLGGAVSGLALGSAGGPPGAVAGFAIGAVAGVFFNSRQKHRTADTNAAMLEMNRATLTTLLKDLGYRSSGPDQWDSDPNSIWIKDGTIQGRGSDGKRLATGLNQAFSFLHSMSSPLKAYSEALFAVFPEEEYPDFHKEIQAIREKSGRVI